jgi:hypothetical protein
MNAIRRDIMNLQARSNGGRLVAENEESRVELPFLPPTRQTIVPKQVPFILASADSRAHKHRGMRTYKNILDSLEPEDYNDESDHEDDSDFDDAEHVSPSLTISNTANQLIHSLITIGVSEENAFTVVFDWHASTIDEALDYLSTLDSLEASESATDDLLSTSLDSPNDVDFFETDSQFSAYEEIEQLLE